MTAFSAHDVSDRGRPSSFAGTTCRGDTSRISCSAHNDCNMLQNRPGRLHQRHGRPHPYLRLASYDSFLQSPRHGILGLSRSIAPGACSNFPTEPFLGLPIGGQKDITLLSVSAPNSSQKCNLLQNRRPRRLRPSRRSGRHRRLDVSPHHASDQGHLNVFWEVKKCLQRPGGSTSCPPPQAPFSSRFVIGARFWAASCTPASSAVLSLLAELGPFNKVFTGFVHEKAIYPCFSLPATRLMRQQQNLISCTPPALRGRPSFFESMEGGTLRALPWRAEVEYWLADGVE